MRSLPDAAERYSQQAYSAQTWHCKLAISRRTDKAPGERTASTTAKWRQRRRCGTGKRSSADLYGLCDRMRASKRSRVLQPPLRALRSSCCLQRSRSRAVICTSRKRALVTPCPSGPTRPEHAEWRVTAVDCQCVARKLVIRGGCGRIGRMCLLEQDAFASLARARRCLFGFSSIAA